MIEWKSNTTSYEVSDVVIVGDEYYIAVDPDARNTLHPVGRLKANGSIDVCTACRYIHNCGDFEGVNERCSEELNDREYYAKD